MFASVKASFAGARVANARTNGVRVQARGAAWFPGTDAPAHLDGSLAGDFGFDPLGLGKDKKVLMRMQEAELQHARWAMLAIPGCLSVEALGYGTWYDAPLWAVEKGTATYLGNEIPGGSNLGAIMLFEVLLMGGAEALRGTEKDQSKRCYPGGAFDPMGFSKGDFETMKLREIKNGRLAMLAFVGFWGQHAATGKGPLAALGEHLANPTGANFATNGVSLPF